jgi:hypothetical protein
LVRHRSTDLDCRVVATSRRVASTECDSRLPLFGRGSTCRLRLLDSWPPRVSCGGSGIRLASRGSTRVSRPVAPTEFDASDKRRTWAVAQLVRLVRLVGRRCHDAARLVRLADGRKSARLVDSSDSSDSVGRRCHDAARLVRLADGRKSVRLVDSSDSSDFVGRRCHDAARLVSASRRSKVRSTRRLVRLLGLSPCEVFRAENDPNRIDAGRRLGSVVRGSDGPV